MRRAEIGPQVRRDRRVRRGRAVHRHAGQAVLERDVPATGLRGRRAPRARDPAGRRGPGRRRRRLPAQVPRQDGGRGAQGRTVLFVSHNLAAVQRLCDRALLIEGGRVAQDGTPADVVAAYVHGSSPRARGSLVKVPEDAQRNGTGETRLREVSISDTDGRPLPALHLGQRSGSTPSSSGRSDRRGGVGDRHLHPGRPRGHRPERRPGAPTAGLRRGPRSRPSWRSRCCRASSAWTSACTTPPASPPTIADCLRFTALNAAEEGGDHYPWPWSAATCAPSPAGARSPAGEAVASKPLPSDVTRR